MSLEDFVREFTPFFCAPICVMIISTAFRITYDLMRGTTGTRRGNEDDIKELRKEVEKINIDKDLQKYFNYKE